MGDLEGLIDEAPGPLWSLAAAITTWVHRDRLEAVRERLAEQYGYDVTPTPEPHTPPVALLDGPSPDAAFADGLSGGARPGGHGVADVLSAGGASDGAGSVSDDSAGGLSAEVSTISYVVLALPDRWRVVEPGHIEVCDGRRSWCGTRTLVTESPGEPAPVSEAGVIAICLYPGRFVAGLAFGAPVADRLHGRDCWAVEARPRTVRPSPGDRPVPTGPLPLSIGRHLSEFVGVEHRFWFDALTGIVLRHEGTIDGQPCSTIELIDVVFDGPVPAAEFATPPGAVVRSRHELLRDHLADLGVDPDTVDLDDPLQVRLALRRGLQG